MESDVQLLHLRQKGHKNSSIKSEGGKGKEKGKSCRVSTLKWEQNIKMADSTAAADNLKRGISVLEQNGFLQLKIFFPPIPRTSV